jgi:tRNA (guanosine-2'-O-)-methyltransferase
MRRDNPDAGELASAPELPADPQSVIEVLAPLLTAERLARIEACLAQRTRSVVPVLDAVDDPHNVAAVLRTADAFGIQEVHLVEGAKTFLASRRVTQGAERWIDLVRHPAPRACVATLRERGFQVYVASMEGNVAPEQLRDVTKLAFVFGNEQSGVRSAFAEICDGRCTIPMAGFAQSLNVSVAAAITLYCATRGRHGDLSVQDRLELRARFMLLSVPRADQVVREQLQRRGQ